MLARSVRKEFGAESHNSRGCPFGSSRERTPPFRKHARASPGFGRGFVAYRSAASCSTPPTSKGRVARRSHTKASTTGRFQKSSACRLLLTEQLRRGRERHGVGHHHGDGRGLGPHHRRHGPGRGGDLPGAERPLTPIVTVPAAVQTLTLSARQHSAQEHRMPAPPQIRGPASAGASLRGALIRIS
jgi:hypothetical protein